MFKRLAILLVFLITLSGCSYLSDSTTEDVFEPTTEQSQKSSTEAQKTEANDIFKVTFIDVGQADCILLQRNSQNMLIDAGDVSTRDYVVSYLQNKGIEKFDIVVGTHLHNDHIGAMDKIVKNFDIDVIYMPKASNNTNAFERLLDEIEAKDLTVTTPVAGSSFKLDDVEFTILAPNASTYDDLNDYSIVLLAKFGDTRFVFTGDAEALSENEIVAAGIDISADVLKVGHHGSYTSSSKKFLDAVNPSYAVIMCGADNSYGHPHNDTMQNLSDRNVQVYRTDLQGDIVAVSDGKVVEFSVGDVNTVNEISVTTTEVMEVTVATNDSSSESDYGSYIDAQGNGLIKGNINSSGEKIYHMPGGVYYDQTNPEELFKTEQEAIDAGYRKSKR